MTLSDAERVLLPVGVALALTTRFAAADDMDMHRVHSNVSIDGLADAIEDEGMFRMD